MNSKQKQAKKAQLVKEYGSRCWWCGRCLPEEELNLEHLKPKSRGGSNSLENLRLAGFSCNRSRGNSLYPPQQCSYLNQSLVNEVRGNA
jgi:5-methylcytosine-specific restriction endonuclease McrA